MGNGLFRTRENGGLSLPQRVVCYVIYYRNVDLFSCTSINDFNFKLNSLMAGQNMLHRSMSISYNRVKWFIVV